MLDSLESLQVGYSCTGPHDTPKLEDRTDMGIECPCPCPCPCICFLYLMNLTTSVMGQWACRRYNKYNTMQYNTIVRETRNRCLRNYASARHGWIIAHNRAPLHIKWVISDSDLSGSCRWSYHSTSSAPGRKKVILVLFERLGNFGESRQY